MILAYVRICDGQASPRNEESPGEEDEGEKEDTVHSEVEEELGSDFVDSVGVLHLGDPDSFVHVVFVVGLVEPTSLQSLDSL